MIRSKMYLKTFYIPCGNLDEDYLNLQLKLKTMQMMTGGQIDIAYLSVEIGVGEFLAMMREEYDPEIHLLPTGGMVYDNKSESYIMEFGVYPAVPNVDMDKYMHIDTERFIALAVYLEAENPSFGEEYIVGPRSKVDYESTFMNMQQEAIRWIPFIDLSTQGLELQDILNSLVEFVVGVIYIGEVAVVVLDTLEYYSAEFLNNIEEPEVPVLDYGKNGSNQNILFGIDNSTDDEDISFDDEDWSSF